MTDRETDRSQTENRQIATHKADIQTDRETLNQIEIRHRGRQRDRQKIESIHT